MTRLADIAVNIRSKNAGPFWLTIDIFCGTDAAFVRIAAGLTTDAVARAFQVLPDTLRRFELPELKVIKFSLPRPVVQGAPGDRDMHGAAWAFVLEGLEIP